MKITENLIINPDDVELKFITSPGPGGQNVNKVATGVVLRFNINNDAIPDHIRKRLLLIARNKISNQGDLIIKGTRFRTQIRNKEDVLERFFNLLKWAATPVKPRKKTKPTLAAKKARLNNKKRRGAIKSLRGKINNE